jgi:hypothetical protein
MSIGRRFQAYPFEDHEVQPALNRLLRTREFKLILHYLFPDKSPKEIRKELKSIQSTCEFQEKITSKAAEFIIQRSTDGFSSSGIEYLDKQETYLFISNHRDIVLDSGLLNYTLNKQGFRTTQLAIGDNLVQSRMLADLFSLNKSFTVKRNVPVSQLLDYTLQLSSYIRTTITQGNSSIWIAQRQGRAIDGNDRTHGGVLKMLSISDEDLSFVDNFTALNIVPVAISYEYDPTDTLKLPRLMAEREGKLYAKKKREDVKAMIAGISEFKGHVHLSIGRKLSREELEPIGKIPRKNERLRELALSIDHHIIRNYWLWRTNFVAYDLLNKSRKFEDHYNNHDYKTFDKLLRAKISGHIGKSSILKELILLQYANPIINKLELDGSI